MIPDSPQPHLIDLNQADADTLATLPGIGPVLARRIVRYREEVHPFEEPVEVTAVKGITEAKYRQFAGQVTVAPPVEPIGATDVPAPQPEVAEPGAVPIPEPAGDRTGLDEGSLEPAPGAAAATLPEFRQAPEAEPPPPAPVPLPSPARVGCWRQVLLVLVGALGGAVLALLMLQSINRTLDFGTHPAVLELNDQMAALELREQVLNDEIGDLRQRLNQFEALSGRLQEAEADIQAINDALEAVEEDVDALEAESSQVQQAVEQIRSATDRFEGFLSGLRDLLLTVEGMPGPTATPTPTVTPPKATPAPTPTPARTPPPSPTSST
ncbi:MAG: helix-hairpin-helix domain-containing protein [Anaerolineae bacterium]